MYNYDPESGIKTFRGKPLKVQPVSNYYCTSKKALLKEELKQYGYKPRDLAGLSFNDLNNLLDEEKTKD